jgi:hypothetical protein
MQSGPERLGCIDHIGAEWRHDGKRAEGFRQFGRHMRLGETQPGRKDEHGLVERRRKDRVGVDGVEETSADNSAA